MTKPNRALSVNASDQRVQNGVASFDHDFAWVCPSQASTGLREGCKKRPFFIVFYYEGGESKKSKIKWR